MAKAEKSSSIKYSDKSVGQPELVTVFNDLKKVMSKFVKGNYVVRDDKPGNYSVYFNKPVKIQGRSFPDLPLAALLIQKGYVGFYFFSIYTEPKLKKLLPPDFARQLRGKSCFYIKKTNPAFLKEFRETLDIGQKYYATKGWK